MPRRARYRERGGNGKNWADPTGFSPIEMIKRRRLGSSRLPESGATVQKPRTKGSQFHHQLSVLKARSLTAQITRNRGRPLLIGRDLQIIKKKQLYYLYSGSCGTYCK